MTCWVFPPPFFSFESMEVKIGLVVQVRPLAQSPWAKASTIPKARRTKRRANITPLSTLLFFYLQSHSFIDFIHPPTLVWLRLFEQWLSRPLFMILQVLMNGWFVLYFYLDRCLSRLFLSLNGWCSSWLSSGEAWVISSSFVILLYRIKWVVWLKYDCLRAHSHQLRIEHK